MAVLRLCALADLPQEQVIDPMHAFLPRSSAAWAPPDHARIATAAAALIAREIG